MQGCEVAWRAVGKWWLAALFPRREESKNSQVIKPFMDSFLLPSLQTPSPGPWSPRSERADAWVRHGDLSLLMLGASTHVLSPLPALVQTEAATFTNESATAPLHLAAASKSNSCFAIWVSLTPTLTFSCPSFSWCLNIHLTQGIDSHEKLQLRWKYLRGTPSSPDTRK